MQVIGFSREAFLLPTFYSFSISLHLFTIFYSTTLYFSSYLHLPSFLFFLFFSTNYQMVRQLFLFPFRE